MKLRTATILAVTMGVGLALLSLAQGQQIQHDDFEGTDPVWARGQADAAFKETFHAITEETAFSGKRSEGIKFTAEGGNAIYYTYATSKAPLVEEFTASIHLKANRPGMRLFVRLVLPRERNPRNLEEMLSVLLPGDTYQTAGYWQPLRVTKAVKVAQDQQKFLQAQLGHAVNLDGAYIDQLVLNVYGGTGSTEVYIDNLRFGPVEEKQAPVATTVRPEEKLPSFPQRPGGEVHWERDQLTVGGQRVFFRGIRRSDTNTPFPTLRRAGFNTVFLDDNTTAEQVAQAYEAGLKIVPVLPVYTNTGDGTAVLTSNDQLGKRMNLFLRPDAVLFWNLGSTALSQDNQVAVSRLVQSVRSYDARPIATDVWDGFQAYSRSVDMLGVHRWPLMTSLELTQFRDWLAQRRLLAQPGTFFWTWVQTHLPDWYVNLVYKQPTAEGLNEPLGPQPEQIWLCAYSAVAAGARGLGFWSDKFLSDAYQGHDRLLALALLNQELQLLEPMLTTAETPSWIDTSTPDVKAAVLRCDRGILVLPMWVGSGSQYVPGQAALSKVIIKVPNIPDGAEALEVSPGEVRGLTSRRILGGTEVELPEFGLTAAIVFTSDNGPNGLIVHFQTQARKMRRMAAQWSRDLAAEEYTKVSKVEAELTRLGHPGKNNEQRLKQSSAYLESCKRLFEEGRDTEAYHEAQRALRPLRILMRSEWEETLKNLDAPSASPYAVSYYTLPRHWQFADRMRTMARASNVLPNGDFETMPDQQPEAWTLEEQPTLDEVKMEARRVVESKVDGKPHEGKQFLKLEVKLKDPLQPLPGALERTFLAVHSPDVQLRPGTPVVISGWVRIPAPILSSVDGVLFYDSAGDVPLAIRMTNPTKKAEWTKFTLYREVPPSGKIHVSVALTGIGTAYFDDIRIEPVVAQQASMKVADTASGGR